MKKRVPAEERIEYRDVDAAQWEAIRGRSEQILGILFPGITGETGGELNVGWRYVPEAKLLMFRIISAPKGPFGGIPALLIEKLVFGRLRERPPEKGVLRRR